MRHVTAILSAAAVVLLAAGLTAQAKPGFAGQWKLMVARGQGEPGMDLIITEGAASMTVEYVRGPAPVKVTYRLDGSVSRNMMPGPAGAPIEQVSRAMWAGNNIVVTTTTSAGEEKRTFSMEGGYLVVEISGPGPTGGAPSHTKVAYQPYVRGFGG
jgi:hypothetical protein